MRGVFAAAWPKVKLKIGQALDRLGLLGLAYSLLVNARTISPAILIGNRRVKRQRVPDRLPIPPERLVGLVISRPDLRRFLDDGESTAKLIGNLLERNGLARKGLKILDFGCGCGRVIRHLKSLGQLYGVDYNPVPIDWCKRNLPFASFDVNSIKPPTPYADETFDFIYAVSVFTHLPESLQLSCIAELWRILGPGGHLLITTLGESSFETLNDEERRRLKSTGLVVRWEKYAGTNICAAFHPKQYVIERLARDFRLVQFIPDALPGLSHQDMYLLRKDGNKMGRPSKSEARISHPFRSARV